jgi:hypothetical protein
MAALGSYQPHHHSLPWMWAPAEHLRTRESVTRGEAIDLMRPPGSFGDDPPPHTSLFVVAPFRSVLLAPFPRRLVGAPPRGSVSSLLLVVEVNPCGGHLQTTTRHGRGHQLAIRRSGASPRRRRDGSRPFREATDWPAAPSGRAMADQRVHALGYRGFAGSSESRGLGEEAQDLEAGDREGIKGNRRLGADPYPCLDTPPWTSMDRPNPSTLAMGNGQLEPWPVPSFGRPARPLT